MEYFSITVNRGVGAGISTLMSISDGLGPSIFCRKMEKARPMREEMDGKETSRNASNTNQGTNEDDSQSDPHPEAGSFDSQRIQTSGQETCCDMYPPTFTVSAILT